MKKAPNMKLVMDWLTIALTINITTISSLHTVSGFTAISKISGNSIPKFFGINNSRSVKKASSRQDRVLSMSSSSDGYPQSGDIVTINYSLAPNDDFVPILLFDVGDDIHFALNKGNYLPAIHAMVSTLKVGQSTTENSIDAGWGMKRKDLVATIAKEKAGDGGMDYDAVKVGTELYLANGSKCRVTQVTDDDFTIDANPPLAGANYQASVKLISIDSGPVKEKYLYVPNGVTNDGGSPYAVMTMALGCFWSGELEYMRVPGVVATAVGYTQGPHKSSPPTYEEVCSGITGHTEGMQLIYDPRIVSYESLVKIGMERLGESRNLKNQTGNDKGTQYRHGVYYHDDEQKKIAMDVIGSYGDECVTECLPVDLFYEAEDYHQQYLLKGGQSARKDATDTIRCYG